MKTRSEGRTSRVVLGLATACILTLLQGCCKDKRDDMKDNIEAFDDLGRKCCQAITDPDLKASCLAQHQETIEKLDQLVSDWYQACRQNDRERKRVIRGLILDILLSAALCQDDGPVVTAADGGYASLASPLAGVDSVGLELEGVARGGRALLSGPVCLTGAEATVCAEAVASIRWVEAIDESDAFGRTAWHPLEFRLSFPDLDGVMLEMIPFEGNGIVTDRRGRTTLGMKMRIQDEVGVFGISPEAWFEFPFEHDGDRVSITVAGSSGLEVAPQVPSVIADWNEDRRVDDLDYQDFIRDLVDGQVDLDGDGASTDLDLAWFGSRWNDAIEG